MRCFQSFPGRIKAAMKAPRGIDRLFLTAEGKGGLPVLQTVATVFKNGEGPGKIPYAKLKTPHGLNSLHEAARAGKLTVCRFLTEMLNFDINATTDFAGETPLHLSICEKHRPTTNFLIDNGADVTKRNFLGQAPLHYAAAEGSKELVNLLMSKGADLNAISDMGMPLHSAAVFGNHDVLQYLLELKGNPNPTIPSFEMSPLFFSLKSIECMDLLLKARADPNRLCYLETPLRYAASVFDVGIIMRLLEAGADPNIPDPAGHTPLEHAAFISRQEVVELLIPVTSRIPCYTDWSTSGVMKHAESKKARKLFKSKLKEVFLLLKAKGGEAFRRKNYGDACIWYTHAAEADPTEADPTDVKVLSNRSLCYAKLYGGEAALADAQKCIATSPNWAMAHYREGAAWNVLKDFTKAAEAFSRAFALDPDNEEIEKAYMVALADRKKFSHWDGDEVHVVLDLEVEVLD